MYISRISEPSTVCWNHYHPFVFSNLIPVKAVLTVCISLPQAYLDLPYGSNAPFGRLEVAGSNGTPPYFQSKTQLNPRKLRCHLKRDHFKRKKHLSTINFQGIFVSLQGGYKTMTLLPCHVRLLEVSIFFWNMPSDALVSAKIPWDLKMNWGLWLMSQMVPKPQWRSTSFRQQKNWHSCFQQ